MTSEQERAALPPLPNSPYLHVEWNSPKERKTSMMYTADQMRDYACAALTAKPANNPETPEGSAPTAEQVMQEIDQSILRSAAQAVVDRWNMPAWNDGQHTSFYIESLRMALALNPVVPASSEPSSEIARLRSALFLAAGALEMVSPCIDPQCKAEQTEWLQDAQTAVAAALKITV